MAVRDFDLRTSSNAESEGAAIKGGSTGCKPNDPIDRSADAIISQAERKNRSKLKDAANSLREVSVQAQDEISQDLTKHACNLLRSQFSQAKEYAVFRVDATTFYVKRIIYKSSPTDCNDPFYWTHVVPEFERTRVVKVTRDPRTGWFCLTCSCKYYERQGFVCRHEFCILCRGSNPLRQFPRAHDAIVRWQKPFGYFYMKPGHEDITQVFDTALENEPIGPQVDLEWLHQEFPVGQGDKQLSFFERGLDRPRIRIDNYWHHRRAAVATSAVSRTSAAAHPFGVQQEAHLSQAAMLDSQILAPQVGDSVEGSSVDNWMEPIDHDTNNSTDNSAMNLTLQHDVQQDESILDCSMLHASLTDGDEASLFAEASHAHSSEHDEHVACSLTIPIYHVTEQRKQSIREHVFGNKLTPYQAIKPTMAELADYCTDTESFSALTDMLRGVKEEMKARHVRKMRTVQQAASSSEFASLPEVDRRHKFKRTVVSPKK